MGKLSAKIVSCMLALCLSVWCVPAVAWAGEAGPHGGSGHDVSFETVLDTVSRGADGDSASAESESADLGNAGPDKDELSSGSAVGDGQDSASSKVFPLRESQNMSVQAAAPASSEPEPVQIEEGFYTIRSAIDSSFALDVSGGSNRSGANVQLWSGNDTAAQTWYVSRNEDGSYSIESLCSGLFLDVQWACLDSGANVWQYSATGTPAQKWKIVDRSEMADYLKARDAAGENETGGEVSNLSGEDRSAAIAQAAGEEAFGADSLSEGDASYMLISECNGLALDVSGAVSANGTNIQCYSPNATSAQGFTLTKVDALSDGIYALKAFADQSKMVEVKWGLRSIGSFVDLYEWNGTPAQKWKVEKGSDGYYSLESVCSGLMLTSADTKTGAVFLTEKVDSAAIDSQKWSLLGNSAGGFCLVSKSSGLALDFKGGDTFNGNGVWVYTKNGSVAQGFILKQPATLVSDGYYTIDLWATCYYGTKTDNAMRLDVAGASREAGANVQLYSGNGTRAQTFHIASNGDGTYTLNIPFSRKALDVRYGGMTPGTNVQQWSRNGSDAQKWRIEYDGTGAVRIVSVLNGLALQVSGDSAVDGANVELGFVSEGIQQRFMLTPTTYVPDDFSDLLAHFSTVSTNTFNGWYNMSRALSNFDGMVVWPGETVSFFDTCGPCGAAEGYLIAGVVGGSGYGGGICQASTTLYGAAVRAGLTIVERQNHTTPSTYVPIGQDAMVNWGSSDFRFRNDWDFPVKIVVDNYDRTLNCDIWGIQPDWYDYIDVSSWWTGSHSAAAQREYYKDGVIVATSALPNSWYW